MTKVVMVVRTEFIPNHAEHDAEFLEILGHCAEVPVFLPDPKDPSQMAIIGEVSNLDELRRVLSTSTGEAFMKKHGFVEELSFFVER